jgi:hypothetical protein
MLALPPVPLQREYSLQVKLYRLDQAVDTF